MWCRLPFLNNGVSARALSTVKSRFQLLELADKYACNQTVKSPDQPGVSTYRSTYFQFNLRGNDPYDISDQQMRHAFRHLLKDKAMGGFRSGVCYFTSYNGHANTGDYWFNRHVDAAKLSMILPLKLDNVAYDLILYDGDKPSRQPLIEQIPAFFTGEHQTVRMIKDASRPWQTLSLLLFLNTYEIDVV